MTYAVRSSRARFLALGVLLLAVLMGATAIVVQAREPVPTPRSVVRSRIQGPQPAPATVRLADGATLRCPRGAVPTVVLENVTFFPRLDHGTTFHRGRYRIVATGSVLNETDHAVRLWRVVPSIRLSPWHARVRGPRSLTAEAKGHLTIVGSYHSTSRGQARLDTSVKWQWLDPTYRPCGERGLVEDD